MSLPTTAIFYKDDKISFKAKANIGWVPDEKLIPRTVREAIDDHNRYWNTNYTDDDWNTVYLYKKLYTKKMLNDIIVENNERRHNKQK